jgi:hypothetical protein
MSKKLKGVGEMVICPGVYPKKHPIVAALSVPGTRTAIASASTSLFIPSNSL